MDDAEQLMPLYLRFVRGVIDSEDLPLNVSREILQQNRVMTNIRSASVKKVLGELKDLSGREPDKYKAFIAEFNRPLKEGLYTDYANKEALLELIRFKSTTQDGWVSLAEYKTRMKDDQKAIYYVSGDSEDRLRQSPLLEMYRKHGIEVLLCSDEIDELVMPMVGKFGDLELKAVNRAGAEKEFDDQKDEAREKEMAPVVEKLKKALGARVKDVRLSARLSESPSCIVVDEHDPSMQMLNLMKSMGRGADMDVKPILEVNGDHALVTKALLSVNETVIADIANVLLDQALLIEGASLKDVAGFVARMNRLMTS